jgi:hypothetical protein
LNSDAETYKKWTCNFNSRMLVFYILRNIIRRYNRIETVKCISIFYLDEDIKSYWGNELNVSNNIKKTCVILWYVKVPEGNGTFKSWQEFNL